MANLDAMRSHWKVVENSIDPGLVASFALDYIPQLLAIIDADAKIAAEAYKQLANWTLDYVREDPGRVIINECVECRKIVDEWDRGHKEGCEVGSIMQKLTARLKKVKHE